MLGRGNDVLGVWVFFRFVRTIIRSMADPEFRALFALVVALLAVGSLFYWQVEGWTLFNSLYFSVITLTTVGYGDFSPHTVLGKAFTIVYIFVGLGILLGFIETIARRSREDDALKRPKRQPNRAPCELGRLECGRGSQCE